MARAERGLHGEAARVADRVRGVLGSVGGSGVGGSGVGGSGIGTSGGGTAGVGRSGFGDSGAGRSGFNGSDAAGSRWRVDPGRRPVLVVGLVVALAAVLTGAWVLSSQPKTMPVSAAAPQLSDAPSLGSSAVSSSSAAASPTVSTSGASAVVVVDVAGKVARPGVYRLPSGSRIDDALKAAGGARRGVDLTSLNLASVLVDGQQIAVGRPGAVAGAGLPPASGGAPSAATGLVNLNTATLEQLDDLPGIGPALSQRILDYRTEHGSFTAVDQLDDVSGIGSVTFEKLKPLVTV